MSKKIAVLGANEPLLPFYKQAKKLGYEIIGIATKEGAVCKEYCTRFYPISFKDKEKVLEICKKEKIDGITSFSLESALPVVAYVVKEMGLVGNSEESLELTSSKFNQRRALEINKIPVPKYYLITSTDDLNKIECNLPIIVKPVDSGGSQGISKVNSLDDLMEAYNYSKEHSRTRNVIVEEYIGGREFSVEYISNKGKHYFLQITDKVTSGEPRFVEMQHHQPANIPEDVKIRIQNMVENALDALKIENSPSHTEIKLNEKGDLFIIETGARMGGDYITSDLVRLSTGYDFVEGTIKQAIGEFEEPQKNQNLYSGVYFYNKLAPYIGDVIRNYTQYPEIKEWEYSNSPLLEVKSNADRRGYLIYQSEKGKLQLAPSKNTLNN